jgi:hypothetical protein
MSDIKHVLIEDARLAQISDEITFGVTSGANQSTYQSFNAISSSANSIIYNIVVPSEAIAIDRCILMRQTINLTIQVANVPPGHIAFCYGVTDSFQAFPLNALMKTVNATINNCSVSTNVQDVLPALVRMCDKKHLARWRGMCPVMPDSLYGSFDQCFQNLYTPGTNPGDPITTNAIVSSIGSPLGSIINASPDCDFMPRGAHPLKYISVKHYVKNLQNNMVLVPYAGGASSLISTALTDTWTIELGIETTEPFMCLSPFTSNPYGTDQAAFIGINNMNFNLNIDSTCRRVWSSALYNTVANKSVPYITSISLGNSIGASAGHAFTEPRMLLNFLTLQPHQYSHIKSKNIIPYYDTPRYISNQGQNQVIPGGYTTGTQIPNEPNLNYQFLGAQGQVTSSNLQLNIVPDYLIISIRKQMNEQTFSDTNSFLSIKQISLSFNNTSGLLANATPQDLWKMSVKNGSSQSWIEFSGINNNTVYNPQEHYTPPLGASYPYCSCGSILVISPNDLNLPDFLSASSLGQFSVYFTATVLNQLNEDIVPEVCIIAVNSGVMTTIQGQSSLNLGLLTKQSVLDAKQQDPVDKLDTQEYARLIGGGMDGRTLSGLRNLARRFKSRKGGSMSAGSMSAGSSSGGARSGMSKYC